MSNVEEILESLKSEEGRKKFEEAADQILNEIKIRNQKSIELVSDEKYINWLEDFSIKHNKFFDEDWLYNPEELSENDRINVDKLCFFFNGIDLYALDNNISPIEYDKSGFINYNYQIKYNDKLYELGLIMCQGSSVSSQVLPLNNNNNYIDFSDIVSYNKAKTYIKK